jgi:serine/threonine protein kinase/tetratricopeptide (TPR) repeat protein
VGPNVSVHEADVDPDRSGGASETLGSTLDADQPRRGVPDGPLDRGTALGRYVILDRIGQGAMGMVYAAFDPALDRKIALKVLRAGREVSTEARDRLVREARAMARLDHPNVVTVHDVGTVDARVFVAMEFVEGSTLREWLRAVPRSWRQIVDAFVQAGEGLAAAHAVGLVHRDFKPDNVMVSEAAAGGLRVRVMDFGLAHVTLASSDDFTATAEVPTAFEPDDESTRSLTRTGAMLGTPAYMAPEQFARSAATASSDQFAFCVALHEALYGQPPFVGDTLPSLAVAVATGTRRATPTVRVPRAIAAVLDRGLLVDAGERWPDMGALLGRLRSATAKPRWGTYVAAASIVAGAAVGMATMRDEPPCRASSDVPGGVWSEPHKAELAQAIDATGVPFAAQSWSLLRDRFDAWTSAWLQGRLDACLATHVRHEQSEAMLDRRIACLDRRLHEARGVLELVAAGDGDDVARIPELLATLGDPTACSDVDALAVAVPMPSDPHAREAIVALDGRIARATAGLVTQHPPALLPEIEQIVADAKALEYAPTTVTALALWATALDHLDRDSASADAAIDAVWVAHAAGDDYAEARAVALAVSKLAEARRSAEVPAWLRHLDASMARFATDDVLAMEKLDAEGMQAFAVDDLAGARAAYTALVARCEEVRSPLECLTPLAKLADVELRASNFAVALSYFERVRDARKAALGPDHPLVAAVVNDVGMTLRGMGRLDEARAQFDEAFRILQAIDPNHYGIVRMLNNRATVSLFQDQFADAERDYRAVYERLAATAEDGNYLLPGIRGNIAMTVFAQGRFDEALAMHREVLATLEEMYDEQSLEVADAVANIGEVLVEMKRWDEARASFERAKKIRVALGGEAHVAVARVECSLGDVALAEGRPADAETSFARCRDGFAKAFGASDPQLATPLRGLGEAYLATGRADEGVATLQRARELLRATAATPRELASVEWPLGRAMWTRADERPAARAMIDAAQQAFATTGGVYADDAAACAAWLRDNPP